jgi:hypothetical protein
LSREIIWITTLCDNRVRKRRPRFRTGCSTPVGAGASEEMCAREEISDKFSAAPLLDAHGFAVVTLCSNGRYSHQDVIFAAFRKRHWIRFSFALRQLRSGLRHFPGARLLRYASSV